jgi:hypothetical protein
MFGKLKFKKYIGVTLIEVAVFIIVMGIIGSGLLLSIEVALQKTPDIEKRSRAVEYAAERMNLITSRDDMFGFDEIPAPSTNYPCAVITCPSYSGFNIVSQIDMGSVGGVAGYKLVTVTVYSGDSSTDGKDQLAKLETFIAS